MSKEVIYTGPIPQCPRCEKPTVRTEGFSSITAAYYPPIYDENGVNTNPDRNSTTSSYNCNGCNKEFSTNGNYTDGFVYCEYED